MGYRVISVYVPSSVNTTLSALILPTTLAISESAVILGALTTRYADNIPFSRLQYSLNGKDSLIFSM